MFYRKIAILLLFISSNIFAQNSGIRTGDWRLHLNFRTIAGFAETPNYIYAYANGTGFFKYDKEEQYLKPMMRTDGFLGIDVTAMAYSETKNALVIAYEGGLFDVVRPNGIQPVFDISRSSILGDKAVKNIYFDEEFAYLVGDFGIVGYDLNRRETKASFINLGFGKCRDIFKLNDTFYVAAEQGIYKAKATGKNLSDPASWTIAFAGDATKLNAIGNSLLAFYNNSLVIIINGGIQYLDYSANYQNIDIRNNEILVSKKDTLLYYDNQLQLIKTEVEPGSLKAKFSLDGTQILYGTGFLGLLEKNRATDEMKFYKPDGAYNNTFGRFINVGDEIWIAGGEMASNFSLTYSYNGLYQYKDNTWHTTLYEPHILISDTLYDFHAMTATPSGDIFAGALGQGICHIRNGKVIAFYDKTNSPLKFTEQSDARYLTDLKADKDGNLWISNFGSSAPLLVRTSKGIWNAFQISGLSSYGISQIDIDQNNYKWIVTPRNPNSGMIVYNDNKTPDNSSDDKYRILSTAVGSGELPTNDVIALTVDKKGSVWVGTREGLCVFYNPGNIFSVNASDAQRIIIGKGDNIGYLLGTEQINCIVVDGGNRKWIGTENSGVWLVSEDGSYIIANYNIDNSPLLSNSVKQIVVNGVTGEVFFGTPKGILSYRTNATEFQEKNRETIVFPNPVRENFSGVITIQGLLENAYVKITDVSGSVVFETQAYGGTATWNGIKHNGQKAKSGVYLVFSGDKAGYETQVSKFVMIAN